ncbi:MAG TPA: DUF6084 family protein [Terriglobales bacterium]|jgi:hypothetical protein|nr:DUF6084 family protein [Terriglobales bacterium]
MPDLRFAIEGAEVEPFAISPQLAFKLRLTNSSPDEVIHSIALRAQVQIESPRRAYAPAEQQNLRDLFGEPERWAQTLRTFLWTHASVIVPSFEGSTEVSLLVPCTFDFNVAATKYFAGLSDGEVPICVQFSGSVFFVEQGGQLQVMPIPWDKEARFRLPVKLWKELMDTYYPGMAWLCLERDAFERLYRYKVERGIPTWEQALESLLRSVEEDVKR